MGTGGGSSICKELGVFDHVGNGTYRPSETKNQNYLSTYYEPVWGPAHSTCPIIYSFSLTLGNRSGPRCAYEAPEGHRGDVSCRLYLHPLNLLQEPELAVHIILGIPICIPHILLTLNLNDPKLIIFPPQPSVCPSQPHYSKPRGLPWQSSG